MYGITWFNNYFMIDWYLKAKEILARNIKPHDLTGYFFSNNF